MKVREVGFRSILHDEAETSGTEMVRKTTFFSGGEEEERCAQRTKVTVSYEYFNQVGEAKKLT